MNVHLDRHKSLFHSLLFEFIFNNGRDSAHRFAALIDSSQHCCRTHDDVMAEERGFLISEYRTFWGFLFERYRETYQLGFAMGISDIAEEDVENGRCRSDLFQSLGYNRSWKMTMTHQYQRGWINPQLDEICSSMKSE